MLVSPGSSINAMRESYPTRARETTGHVTAALKSRAHCPSGTAGRWSRRHREPNAGLRDGVRRHESCGGRDTRSGEHLYVVDVTSRPSGLPRRCSCGGDADDRTGSGRKGTAVRVVAVRVVELRRRTLVSHFCPRPDPGREPRDFRLQFYFNAHNPPLTSSPSDGPPTVFSSSTVSMIWAPVMMLRL